MICLMRAGLIESKDKVMSISPYRRRQRMYAAYHNNKSLTDKLHETGLFYQISSNRMYLRDDPNIRIEFRYLGIGDDEGEGVGMFSRYNVYWHLLQENKKWKMIRFEDVMLNINKEAGRKLCFHLDTLMELK